MPRKPRYYLPDVPCHIVQRGNNRHACFYSAEDFGFYINTLAEALEKFEVKLHAFVLMTNHNHLLMTPSDTQGISLVMQYLGRRYVRYINTLYHRTGTLWEGRHKASLIDSDNYLLTCMRYIELNPVRAQMVTHPSEYLWSSYQANAMGKAIKCITPHPTYLSLDKTKASRLIAYRELFRGHLSDRDIHNIRQCLDHNYPMGNQKFKLQIEAALKIKLGHFKQGRPRSEI